MFKRLHFILHKQLNVGKQFISDNLPLFIFSVAYYCIILFLADYLNIWEDEVYSLNTSSGSLRYAFNQSFEFEFQPPVYFLFLTLWRILSGSVFWARLLSILFIIISQVILFHFVKNITGKRIATLTSMLFLLNPLTVFAALEIRTFPLVLLLSTLITTCFFNTYFSNKISAGVRIGFILLSLFGVFTQYFIGFLLFGNAVVLLFRKNWETLKIYVLDMLLPLFMVILFLPLIVKSSGYQASSLPLYNRTFIDFILEVKSFISMVTMGYFLPLDHINSKMLQWIIRILSVGLLLWSLNFKEIRKYFQLSLPFIILSLVVLLFYILILIMFGKYAIEYKYTVALFVPLFIVVLCLFGSIKLKLRILFFIWLSLIYISFGFNKYYHLYKVNDVRSLCNYIEMTEGNCTPIFVYRNISGENLGYYYDGINEIVPIPEPFHYDRVFGPEQWEINDEDINRLDKKLLHYSSFYVVIDNSSLRGVNESKAVLLEYLLKNFKIEEMKVFNGKVALYKISHLQLI